MFPLLAEYGAMDRINTNEIVYFIAHVIYAWLNESDNVVCANHEMRKPDQSNENL